MSIVVKNNIHWVGQRDWEVRDFHGTEYKTLRGSSYNSYLIREEKNVLIDTVDHTFSREFMQNLRNEIDLADIDYIVINHAEEDHAGALTELMAQIPDTPIYCTANAIDSINGHHHHPEWNFNVVKTGDTLDIGNGKQLIFVETPMLHWPDSMMTYLTGDAVLFSNDAFGQHYCDEHLFNDEVDQTELFEQCQRYYANILTPFSRLVTPKITEILGFNLPVDMIATSHGVVWRDNPTQIVELYLKWAADYQEDRITIFYDTMSNNTRMMADAIAQGIAETALARRAGLTINRGVCVDSYLQTSNADIYALGDCAEINGQVLPFLQPIQLSAMVLAKNLLGNNTPLKLPAMLVKIKTPELPLHLAGETQRQDLRWQINTERQGMVARGVDDADQLRAFVVSEDRMKEAFGLLKTLPV